MKRIPGKWYTYDVETNMLRQGPFETREEALRMLDMPSYSEEVLAPGAELRKISRREHIQHEFAEWLRETGRFTAPYGIIEGLETLHGGGKARTLTFGVVRHLRAHLLASKHYHSRLPLWGRSGANAGGC